MALQVRVAEPAQSALDCAVRSGPGSPILAAKRVERVRDQRLLAHVPVIACAQNTRGARALEDAHSSGASSSKPSGTSRQHQHERAHGGSEAGQHAESLG